MNKVKFIAAATIAATMLGMSTPAFATEDPGPSDVTVNIVDAAPGEEIFELKTVPTGFEFESVSLEDGNYQLTAEDIAEQITVFKNFAPRIDEETQEEYDVRHVSAKVSSLVVNDVETDTIEVTGFKINDIPIGGSTGEKLELYGDTAFDTFDSDTGYYGVAVDSAEITFERIGLTMEDVLSGTITYSVDDVSPAT